MFHYITECRACFGTELIPVFSLGLQPLANSFAKREEEQAGFVPLDVLLCPKCTLSQLSVVVNGDILYRNYKYVTSRSEIMRRHFERLFKDLESEVADKTIVEIGSNDGLCLKFAKAKGYRAIGIDPAKNLAAIAKESDIHTIPEFFDQTSAYAAKDCIGHPAVILARHCFAHMPNWKEFVAALEILAGPKTVIALEVPYIHDLLAKSEFDSVYHEHTSYVSLTAIYYLLRGSPFNIHRVIRYGVHGGSLLIMLRHKDSKIEPHLSADEYLSEDAVTVQHWEKFRAQVALNTGKLRDVIRDANKAGKRVCGFGASAKATVWINALGLTKKDLLFVSDNSPFKPGCLVPGTDIPVIDQDDFLSEHPDIAVCFAWNFKEEILKTQQKWRDRGGKFIFPTV